MAISHTIDTNDPDGTSKNVSYLDDSVRQEKVDVKERIEDSIIDTGVSSWVSTTSKELKEGLARAFTTTKANQATIATDFSPQTLVDGKLWVGTDGDNTHSFEYYNGAAWTVIPIGTSNLLASSVTTAKIAAQAVTAFSAEQTSTADITQNAAAWVQAGTFGVTVTPNSTSSILVMRFMCMAWKATGGTGQIRIRNTTDGTTLAETLVDSANFGTKAKAISTSLVAFATFGAIAAKTFQVQIACSDANVFHLDGTITDIDAAAIPLRFQAYEIKI